MIAGSSPALGDKSEQTEQGTGGDAVPARLSAAVRWLVCELQEY